MTLRKKTLLIIAGTFYGVIILLFFLSRNILLESFVRLEEQSTHQDVERVLSKKCFFNLVAQLVFDVLILLSVKCVGQFCSHVIEIVCPHFFRKLIIDSGQC